MKNIDTILNKFYKNKIKNENDKKEKRKQEYIENLENLKMKVEEALNEERIYIYVKGYWEEKFARSFFNNSEITCCGDCETGYSVSINEVGLKKLYKEIDKYKLEEYHEKESI